MAFTFGDHAIGLGIDGIRWPDHVRAFPRIVITHRPFFWRVKRFVWIKLVDEQHEALAIGAVMRRILNQPLGGGLHGARAWVIFFTLEPAARVVVVRVASAKCRCANPARIWSCLPRITFVTALIRPRSEIGVEVFSANFKKVRVIGDEVCYYAGTTKRNSDRFFPDFNRAPWLPQKIPCTNQDVVARGDARQ